MTFNLFQLESQSRHLMFSSEFYSKKFRLYTADTKIQYGGKLPYLIFKMYHNFHSFTARITKFVFFSSVFHFGQFSLYIQIESQHGGRPSFCKLVSFYYSWNHQIWCVSSECNFKNLGKCKIQYGGKLPSFILIIINLSLYSS